MKKLTISAITIILTSLSQLAACQDFVFTWEIRPSFSSSYSVTITNRENIGRVSVVKEFSDDTLAYSVDVEDIRRLQSFLDSYDFPHRDAREIDSISRRYLPTTFPSISSGLETSAIHDSTEVIVGTDTLHAGWVRFLKGYKFDSIKRQYYRTIEHGGVWTDGTNYTGRYQTDGVDRTYHLFSARFQHKDLKLNEIVLDIITKKERLLRYLEIQQEIQRIRIRN